MESGRKNNGGNSTKSTRPDDKRLKCNKDLLEVYIRDHVTDEKIQKLLDVHYAKGLKGDYRSASFYMSYIVGKPKETKDLKLVIEKNLPDWLDE